MSKLRNDVDNLAASKKLTVKESATLLDVLQWLDEIDGISYDRLRVICAAELNGTLHIAPNATDTPVWLPCKVGDTMYSSTLGKVRSFIVAGFEFYGKKLLVVEQIKIGREMREYGKAAHRTQAEAEAALAPEGGQGDARSTP